MPEAGLNCIVCLRQETKTPRCPAALIRTGRLEEHPGDSTTIVEAKLLAQHQTRRETHWILIVLSDAVQQHIRDTCKAMLGFLGFSSLDV